jgi:hypothetical protein
VADTSLPVDKNKLDAMNLDAAGTRAPAQVAGVSVRVIVLAIVLSIIQLLWTMWATDKPRRISFGVGGAIPQMPLFSIFLCLVFNSLVGRRLPRWKFSLGEMVSLFILQVMALSFGMGFYDLSPMITYPISPAFNKTNNLFSSISQWIPGFMSPHDPTALKPLYEGIRASPNPNAWNIWNMWSRFLDVWNLWSGLLSAWTMPIIYWCSMMAIFGIMYLSMNSLLYYRWAKEERLEFPLVRLPLMLAQSGNLGGLFRNRLFIIAAGLVFIFETMNLFSSRITAIPHIPFGMIEIPPSPTPPLSYLGYMRVSFQPYLIGLCFVLPLDLLFSSWALYFVRKIEDVVCGSLGVLDVFPIWRDQANGAWIAIFFIVLWSSRRHLARLGKIALGIEKPDQASKGSPFSPRLALLGVICGFIALVWMAAAAGMALWFAIAFFLLYFMLAVTMNRVACQLGTPISDNFPTNLGYALTSFIGSANISPKSQTIMTSYYWFYRSVGGTAMSSQMYGFRYADETRQSQSSLARAMLIAMLIAIPIGMVGWLVFNYDMGFGTARDQTWRLGGANEAQSILTNFLNNPQGPQSGSIIFTTGSAIFTFLLAAAQRNLMGFPFHPLGWALANIWVMYTFWSLFMVVWFVKLLVLRYGGLRLYRQLLPFFLGMVFGDCMVSALMAIINSFAGLQGVTQY